MPPAENSPLRLIQDGASEMIEKWADELDFKKFSKSIQEFGHRSPFALALASLTVGLAAGLLLHQHTRSRGPSRAD